jgi:NADPH:quinone reductase-like Zn-dependent oxidoreductase
MKAFILRSFGDTDNLVERDIPIPEISENEVLVKVKAISINPVDVKTRKGKGLAAILKDFDPILLGWDISGTIIRKGRDVSLFNEGDDVFGMINFPGHGKAYAEYVSASEGAAAASLAALTAWQFLKEKSVIKPGAKVLIHSAAGGVGHYAVQIAKYFKAEVTGTASAKNRDFVYSLGANHVIDYENQRFEDLGPEMDLVLDTIGGEYSERSLKVLKPGGSIICLPSGASENLPEMARKRGLNGYHYLVESNGKNMNEIAWLLENEFVKSFVSGIFTFDEIREAHSQIETGRTKGKIVVAL